MRTVHGKKFQIAKHILPGSKGKTATPVAQQQLPLALSAQNNFKLYTLSDNNTPPLAPQPVGFVTFHTRAGAEAAKQDLQVWNFHVPRLFLFFLLIPSLFLPLLIETWVLVAETR